MLNLAQMVTVSWPAREEWSSSAPAPSGWWDVRSCPELNTRIARLDGGREKIRISAMVLPILALMGKFKN